MGYLSVRSIIYYFASLRFNRIIYVSKSIYNEFLFKKILKSRLTSRTQYNLWFLPLCLMAVPFIPVRSDRMFSVFSLFMNFDHGTALLNNTANTTNTSALPDTASGWMNDFTVSVSSRVPSLIGRYSLESGSPVFWQWSCWF